MRSAIMTVGDGITSLKQFSIVFPLSKSNISWVPVPTSTASIRKGLGMLVLLAIKDVLLRVYHAQSELKEWVTLHITLVCCFTASQPRLRYTDHVTGVTTLFLRSWQGNNRFSTGEKE